MPKSEAQGLPISLNDWLISNRSFTTAVIALYQLANARNQTTINVFCEFLFFFLIIV